MAKEKEPKSPGINRKNMLNALEAWKRPRVDTKNPQAIAERIEEYLKYCVDNDLAPGVAACASWLGISVYTLSSWYSGKRGSPEHQRVAAKLYGVLQNVWEQDMHDGNINTIGGIYVGKAFFGFVDSQEIIVQHTGQTQLTAAELIAESKLLPGAETIDAEYTVVGDEPLAVKDPRYERALARKIKAEERKAATIANQPNIKARKKEYHKKYYLEHKEEMDETRRRNKQKAAERAQKERAERAQKERAERRNLQPGADSTKS